MIRRLLARLMCTLAFTSVMLSGAAPARACECAETRPRAPIEFTGTAVEIVEAGAPPLWRFRTDDVLRGSVGPEALVRLSVPVDNPDGSTSATSCDIGQKPLVPGGRYRVQAFGNVTGTGQLSVNRCGGSLSALPASLASDSPSAAGGRTLRLVAALAVSGLVAAAVIDLARRRRVSES